MRAIDRLDVVEARLKSTEKDFEDARKAAKQSRESFTKVKDKRFDLFNKAFTHISEQISHVYKDLTRPSAKVLQGVVYTEHDSTTQPCSEGRRYTF